VTFGDLDGSARPEPPASSAPHVLGPNTEAFAAVRTEQLGGDTKYVPDMTVAPDPGQPGFTFTAAEIGASPAGIPVWDPVTTWWQPTPDDAVAALPPA
jgi:hypothetical protein